MKQVSNKQLANEAFDRYAAAKNEIDKVRTGIEMNRRGEAELSDISGDAGRLARRIAREGMPISEALERINGVPNFQDILILKKIFRLSEAIGRITIKNQYGTSGFGTGFLIAPGIIITNHHVFPDAATAAQSYIQFNYELNDKGEPVPVQTFNLKPDKLFITSPYDKSPEIPFSGLDFSIVAVEEKSKEGKRITDIPSARLDESVGKIIEGENCIVIQHPKGDYKKIVLKDIRMLALTNEFLIYESDTLPGSSGAMVVGLGTGEVVALHHSGVPKKNAQGQWLRKDGGVVQAGDSDDSIDWIGNEGIRVSSLIKAIKGIKIPKSMQAMKDGLLGTQLLNDHQEEASPNTMSQNFANAGDITENKNPVVSQAIHILQGTGADSTGQQQYFEVELSAHEDMQQHWKENYRTLVPGIVSSEAVFPLSTDPAQRRIFYLTIRSDENPWELAAKLEALPQITIATPDLPMDTDMQNQHIKSFRGDRESFPFESTNDGTAAWNEDKFISNWKGSEYFRIEDKMDEKEKEKMRKWNRLAVGLDGYFRKKTDITKIDWDSIKKNIDKIKLVQFDTGYTDHSKVHNGFDLDNDEDFIDGEDAKDEMASGMLQHPGHGTRTASLVIGTSMSKDEPFKGDGNFGVVRDTDGASSPLSKLKVVPYRIAQSVILIGRGKNLVDAVNQAINSDADIMFMCMGSYPRPMIYEAAKAAYDRGVIWCCAAGNEVEMVIAPALYPGTIAVAAINPFNYPWRGSSYGPTVDIAAPGEDVYVPFVNKKYEEIMVYGSGTSYATPHVASAAVLWKAKHYQALASYSRPWMLVEAFRHCLKNSAYLPVNWDNSNYGAGILHIPSLLECKLPEEKKLVYAYADKPARPEWDLGIRETAHHLWRTLVKKITPGPESTSPEMFLTERARISISALTAGPAASVFESSTAKGQEKAEKILNMYFESYK